MRKEKVVRTTKLYDTLAAESKAIGEHNDCGVKALAVVCGVSYKRAHAALRRVGRKPGSRTSLSRMQRAIERLDCYVYRLLFVRPGMTLNHIEDSDEIDCGCWLIHVSGHWVGMADRTIHDWSVGQARRIKSARKVVKRLK